VQPDPTQSDGTGAAFWLTCRHAYRRADRPLAAGQSDDDDFTARTKRPWQKSDLRCGEFCIHVRIAQH